MSKPTLELDADGFPPCGYQKRSPGGTMYPTYLDFTQGDRVMFRSPFPGRVPGDLSGTIVGRDKGVNPAYLVQVDDNQRLSQVYHYSVLSVPIYPRSEAVLRYIADTRMEDYNYIDYIHL